jgi:hypothetical protein
MEVEPLASGRAPAPPYHPMRKSVQLAVREAAPDAAITLIVSPALALTRSA